eukprot:Tbor_TRINITY_DN3586_c0_g1::TRINITY_DN3586_c0_g1_i1::g.2936::m.2936
MNVSIDDDSIQSLNLLVECGSGPISICGPPGCGKTTSVLRCTSARELLYNAKVVTLHARALPIKDTNTYALQRVAESVSWREAQHYRYIQKMCQFMVCLLISEHVKHYPELHIIVEDAQVLSLSALSDMAAWCMRIKTDRIIIWFLSSTLLEIPGCWRYKFMTKPSADDICNWLKNNDNHSSALDELPKALEAARVFSTRNPMKATIFARDPRSLMKCVYELRESLLQPGSSLNSLDYSRAWASFVGAVSQPSHISAASSEPIYRILHQGVTAQALSVASFYCGAVSEVKDRDTFSVKEISNTKGKKQDKRKQGAVSKDSVISSSNYHFLPVRLWGIYSKLLKTLPETVRGVCLDPSIALHHLGNLVDWGILKPSSGHRSIMLQCTLSLSDAAHVASNINIDLLELIPEAKR